MALRSQVAQLDAYFTDLHWYPVNSKKTQAGGTDIFAVACTDGEPPPAVAACMPGIRGCLGQWKACGLVQGMLCTTRTTRKQAARNTRRARPPMRQTATPLLLIPQQPAHRLGQDHQPDRASGKNHRGAQGRLHSAQVEL